MTPHADSYPVPIDGLLAEGDELIPVAEFHRRVRNKELTDSTRGAFHPATADRVNLDFFVFPSDRATVPFCSTHILWIT